MTISASALKSALRSAQTWWDDMGVDVDFPVAQIKKKRSAKIKRSAPVKVKRTPAPITKTHSGVDLTQITAKANAATTLDALKEVISGLDVGDLSDNAKNTVFARGKAGSALMCIGETPGVREDEKGLPFVGEAGQLLDKMLAAIGQSKENTYIANICNWRPPNNRNLTDDEIALCRPLITRHIELATPKVIVIVGGVSLLTLTKTSGIMKARGQWQALNIGGRDIPAMPLYHPAFLLRRPELKKDAWRDLLAIKEKLAGL